MLTVKAVTLILISGCCSVISYAKEGKLFGEELISCLGRANVRAFHGILTVCTLSSHLLTLKAHIMKSYVCFVDPYSRPL